MSTVADVAASEYLAPDYRGACITNLTPALLEHPAIGEGWVPDDALHADQVALLVIDGLGWLQLQARRELAPTLAGAAGGPITSVAPSTTATALTSITTGMPPGEHGIVGYRMRMQGQTLNVLRWSTERGDARSTFAPAELQPHRAFGGRPVTVVNQKGFVGSGFTIAHLAEVDYRPYGAVSTLVHEMGEAARQGSRFIYGYYDGLDRVGHERGHDAGFDAEFGFVDRLVRDVRQALPAQCRLLVTADHGQVDTAGCTIALTSELDASTVARSGEDRFLWLHTERGAAGDVASIAADAHESQAWVKTREQVIDEGLLGSQVTSEAAQRLGDVAMVAKERYAFVHAKAPPKSLIGRHGSLTAAEMLVPLLQVS